MSGIGGSIEAVSIDGRNFPVTADGEANRKLGGFENETQANGDGSARMVKTRVNWNISGLPVEIDDTRADQEFLQDLADGTRFFPVVVTYASGAVYQGQGQITGELQFNNSNSTAELNMSGPGRLTPQ